ncbi:hypothetical protein FHG87_019076 [Trinorchestia longiramus]|nr:hypothetical protein FHG87_019076 [Trinorchestia longiramus]
MQESCNMLQQCHGGTGLCVEQDLVGRAGGASHVKSEVTDGDVSVSSEGLLHEPEIYIKEEARDGEESASLKEEPFTCELHQVLGTSLGGHVLCINWVRIVIDHDTLQYCRVGVLRCFWRWIAVKIRIRRVVAAGWFVMGGPLLLCWWSLRWSRFLFSCLHSSSWNESKSHKDVSTDIPQVVLKGRDSRCKDRALKVGKLGLEARPPEFAADGLILVLRLVEEASAEKA